MRSIDWNILRIAVEEKNRDFSDPPRYLAADRDGGWMGEWYGYDENPAGRYNSKGVYSISLIREEIEPVDFRHYGLPEWGVIDLKEEKVLEGPPEWLEEKDPEPIEGILADIAEGGCFYVLLDAGDDWAKDTEGSLIVVSGSGHHAISLVPNKSGGFNMVHICTTCRVRKIQTDKDLECLN